MTHKRRRIPNRKRDEESFATKAMDELIKLSEKELDYVRYNTWPDYIDIEKEAKKEKEKDDQMHNLIKEMFGEPSK